MCPPALRWAFLLAARYQVKLIDGALTHLQFLGYWLFQSILILVYLTSWRVCGTLCRAVCPLQCWVCPSRLTFRQAPSWELNLMVGVEAFPGKPPPTILASETCRGSQCPRLLGQPRVMVMASYCHVMLYHLSLVQSQGFSLSKKTGEPSLRRSQFSSNLLFPHESLLIWNILKDCHFCRSGRF